MTTSMIIPGNKLLLFVKYFYTTIKDSKAYIISDVKKEFLAAVKYTLTKVNIILFSDHKNSLYHHLIRH